MASNEFSFDSSSDSEVSEIADYELEVEGSSRRKRSIQRYRRNGQITHVRTGWAANVLVWIKSNRPISFSFFFSVGRHFHKKVSDEALYLCPCP